MSLRMLHLQNETIASCPDLQGQGYRASFHSHSAARGPRKKIYHGHLGGSGPRKGEHAVVKVFRDHPGTEAMCDAEIDKHRLAQKLARRFNKTVPEPRGKISFTLPLKSTVESLGVGQRLARHRRGRHLDKMEWVLIEENLTRQGEYQVFIQKCGDIRDRSPTTLDAFLHFTYHESGRKFLLCGFQGVQTESGYVLTTPCIHSEDSSFGAATDGGPKMLRKVFEQHRCNNLCYSFERPLEMELKESSNYENEGKDDDNDDDDDDEEEESFIIRSKERDKTDSSSNRVEGKLCNAAVDDSQDERRDSTTSNDDVFLAQSVTELVVMTSEGHGADRRLMLNGFSLGKEDTMEDLAYCCTGLSREIIEEIEEEQRNAEKKKEQRKKSENEYKRIHLGDQIKKEKKTEQEKTTVDTFEPTHRCNVLAIGGIKKRPSY